MRDWWSLMANGYTVGVECVLYGVDHVVTSLMGNRKYVHACVQVGGLVVHILSWRSVNPLKYGQFLVRTFLS